MNPIENQIKPVKWQVRVIPESDIEAIIAWQKNTKNTYLIERDPVAKKGFGVPIFGRPGRPEEAYLPS